MVGFFNVLLCSTWNIYIKGTTHLIIIWHKIDKHQFSIKLSCCFNYYKLITIVNNNKLYITVLLARQQTILQMFHVEQISIYTIGNRYCRFIKYNDRKMFVYTVKKSNIALNFVDTRYKI